MNKLAIAAFAALAASCLMASSASAASLDSAIGNLQLTVAMNCGCEKKCCEPKCCKPKCCKPKCCEPKCCEPCCKKKRCCPAEPEYPVVCAHNHEDLQRDLVSRKHAPWQ